MLLCFDPFVLCCVFFCPSSMFCCGCNLAIPVEHWNAIKNLVHSAALCVCVFMCVWWQSERDSISQFRQVTKQDACHHTHRFFHTASPESALHRWCSIWGLEAIDVRKSMDEATFSICTSCYIGINFEPFTVHHLYYTPYILFDYIVFSFHDCKVNPLPSSIYTDNTELYYIAEFFQASIEKLQFVQIKFMLFPWFMVLH